MIKIQLDPCHRRLVKSDDALFLKGFRRFSFVIRQEIRLLLLLTHYMVHSSCNFFQHYQLLSIFRTTVICDAYLVRVTLNQT